MKSYFKSALDKIKADDEIILRTQKYVNDSLKKRDNLKFWFFKTRSEDHMKKIIFAACAAVLICGISAGGYAYYKTPIAYLSVDINPSVELGINSMNKVVSATAYNDDGKTVLDGKAVVNSDIKDAVDTIVQSASDKGFIADDGSTIVSVTAETDDTNTADKIDNEAQTGADEALKTKDNKAVVYKDKVAIERRDEARKLGITPGKLNLIQKLQALDPTVTVDQYKNAKVKDIMKKVVELKKQAKSNDTNISKGSPSNTDNTADCSNTDAIEKAVSESVQIQQQKSGNSSLSTVTVKESKKANSTSNTAQNSKTSSASSNKNVSGSTGTSENVTGSTKESSQVTIKTNNTAGPQPSPTDTVKTKTNNGNGSNKSSQGIAATSSAVSDTSKNNGNSDKGDNGNSSFHSSSGLKGKK